MKERKKKEKERRKEGKKRSTANIVRTTL
jgi:hypothetical protein